MTSQQQGLKPSIYKRRNIRLIASLGWVFSFPHAGSFLFESGSIAMSSRSEKNDRSTSMLTIPEARILPVYWWKKRRNTGEASQSELTPANEKSVSRNSGGPVGPAPDPGPWSNWPDLLAFVAVLTAGVLLVLAGHVTVGGLTTACAALGGLFAAWRGLRRPPRQ
jgi:hypothetical protein